MNFSLVFVLLYSFLIAGSEPVATTFTHITFARDSSSTAYLLNQSDKYTFSNPKKSKQYAKRALQSAYKTGDESGEIRGFYQLGALDIGQGDLKNARAYFENGLKKARKINDRSLIASGFYNVSRFYEGEENFSKALDYLNQSFSIYQRLGNNKSMANCYNSYGRIYMELASYDKALNYYFKSLKIQQKLDNKRGISVAKTNIGMVYMDNGQYKDAIRFFSQALKIDQSDDDKEGIEDNTLDNGVARQKMGDYNDALDKYKKALVVAKQIDDQIGIAILLGNIGSTLRQQGNYEGGLSYLFSSLAVRKRIHYNRSHTLNDISVAYLALNNLPEAKKYAQEAVKSSEKTDDAEQLHSAYLNLAEVTSKQDDFKDAYTALKQADIIKDSLSTLGKARQMQKLQVIYATKQKEQKIKLLTLQQQTATFRRNAYLISAGLVISFLILLYNRQRLKSRKNGQLLQKEQEVTVMKSNFFDNISHEFRTPLTLILGPLQLLLANTKNPEMKKQLGVMDRNVNRLLSLINQLLDLSKLESGRATLRRSRFDIVQVVKGVTMTFQSLAEMKGIELSLESVQDYREVYYDKEKIETILTNLLTNAFHFTPDGGEIKVTLNVTADNQHEGLCEISVSDSGLGIPEEDFSNVFDRFHQSVNMRDGQYEGTGIGLALTKELVELHKGSISVFSQEGEGTKFTVRLPVNLEYTSESKMLVTPQKEVTGLAEPISDKIHKSKELMPSLPSQENVPILLLIEDNDDVMHYLKDILSETYQVFEAKDGEAGIAMAIETIPDLIVCDVMMPKKNGYEVCNTLKHDEKTSHIPVILLTARASLDDKMHGLKIRADEYLTKPFVPDELLLRIQNLIESRNRLMEKFKHKFIIKPDEVSAKSIDEAFLLRVGKAVGQHLSDEQFGVEQLGREVGMSRSQIHRKLVALTDQSATEFIRSFRLHRAKEMISKNVGSISEISYAVGFGSPSYFSKCFRREFGMTPSEAKNPSA